jgi:hypothetical protein
MNFQWDELLLEAGFLAIFYARIKDHDFPVSLAVIPSTLYVRDIKAGDE